MSEEELAWRTPLVEEPEVPLWEAVEHIAETTGLAQMVHNSPISGIGRAEDLLVGTNRRAQPAKPVLPMEEYVPLSIGIGPETRPVNPALARGDIPLGGQRSLDGSLARCAQSLLSVPRIMSLDFHAPHRALTVPHSAGQHRIRKRGPARVLSPVTGGSRLNG